MSELPSPTPNLSVLADKWNSAVVSREKIGDFTGGTISPKSMANLDSKGEGPEGAILIGKKVAYPVSSLIAWLERRAKFRRCLPTTITT
jgi:hypothetical protein